MSGAPQPVAFPKPLLKNIVVREEADLLEQLKEAVQVGGREGSAGGRVGGQCRWEGGRAVQVGGQCR